jgi:aldehyde:ferredoxin oxidoreductase
VKISITFVKKKINQEKINHENEVLKMYGYQGKMLVIDLTEGRFQVENFEELFVRNYMGGVGFGIKLLYDRLTPQVDPLSPENQLILCTATSRCQHLWHLGARIIFSSNLV